MTMKFMAVALMLGIGTLANAAGVAFNSTSLPRQMRQEGTTEAAGEVQLTAATAGTVKGGSSIDVVFSVAITNNSSLSTNNISKANNVFCTAAATACPSSAAIQGTQTVRMSFAADQTFAVGGAIVLSRVRVNANSALGVGSVIVTLAGGSSDPVNNAITFSDPQRQVGVLNPTITVTTTSTSLPNSRWSSGLTPVTARAVAVFLCTMAPRRALPLTMQ